MDGNAPGTGLEHLPKRVRKRSVGVYSRFVGMMKYLMPVLAVVLLAAVFFWPQFISTKKQATNSVLQTFKPDDLNNFQMVAPNFVGTDDKNRPYRVTAELARMENRDSDIIKLQKPKADITLENGQWIAVTARDGVFHQKDKQIELIGDVNVYHDAGYTFKTEYAHIDVTNGTAEGNKPVAASGPKGTLTAEGFKITDKGKTVVFTGKSRVVFNVNDQDTKEIFPNLGQTDTPKTGTPKTDTPKSEAPKKTPSDVEPATDPKRKPK